MASKKEHPGTESVELDPAQAGSAGASAFAELAEGIPDKIKERRTGYRWVICGLIFFFLIAPIVVIIPLSFNAEPYFTFTDRMLSFDPEGYSTRWYRSLLTFGMQNPDATGWAFWSVTMYDGKSQLLIKNPIDRYLINSPMLPDLKQDPDGGYTIYVQRENPGSDKESNWLPAPEGPFRLTQRLYWPKEAALDGTWQAPVPRKVA